MKYLLLVIAASIAILYARTQCDCELGLYLRDVDGRCSAEFKHFDTPAIAMGCNPVFTNFGDSIDVDACTDKGLNVTLYRDENCTKKLIEEYLPTGHCHAINFDNRSLAVMTTCGEQ